jgi:hypothetical protein
MKYIFFKMITGLSFNVIISAGLLLKCSSSSLVLNISAKNILSPRYQLFSIAGKKSLGNSRGFQTQKETRYNEARKKGKELVRDGIAFLY